MIRSRPGNVGGTEEGDDRSLEGRGEVARPGIGGDQERRAAHAGFRESQAQRLLGQADHGGMIGQPDDLAGWLAFGRPAEHEHGDIPLLHQPASAARQTMRWASSWPARTLRPYSDRPRDGHRRQSQVAPGPIGRRTRRRGWSPARAGPSRPGSPASLPGPGSIRTIGVGKKLPSASRGGWRLSVKSSPRPYRT